MEAFSIRSTRPGSSAGPGPTTLMQNWFKRRSILPGFLPAFSYTVLYLSLIVLILLSAVLLKSTSSGYRISGRW